MNNFTITDIAQAGAPDRIKGLSNDFHSERAILVPIGAGKTPIRKWKTEDKENLNLEINWNGMFLPTSDLERIAIGFNNNIEEKIVVVDIDTADQGALALVETVLTTYNGKIIAYPTRKGAHLWFTIPEELQDGKWWTGRKVGYVTKTGIGPVDYLNGGLINVALKSNKTNQIELLLDTDRFNDDEINQDMKTLFERVGFQSLELNWNVLENLPELPNLVYPLKKAKTDETFEDIKFSTGAGVNTQSFTNWAGQLNMKSELYDDVLFDMEECLYWMNDNLTGKYVFEDLDSVIQSVSAYDNEHCFEPYKLSGKVRAERQIRKQVGKIADLSKTDVDWNHYLKEIKTTSKVDNAEFLIEALDVRLLSGTTLVLRKGQKDIVDSRTVAAAILSTRQGFWDIRIDSKGNTYDVWVSFAVDVKWAKAVMESMVALLSYKIDVEYQTQYVANYVSKPLWVDNNGLVIDPFDLTTAEGKLKLQSREQAGIDRDVVPFHLAIDFNNLVNYDKESYELFHKWVINGVGNDIEKFNYFFKYYGYTMMIGQKFTRQIGFIGGVTGSGKSSLEEITSKTVIGAGRTGIANANLFDGKFGLQAIAGKSRGVLDEGASAFKGNSEDLKRISGTQTTLVEPKGQAVFEAFVPKITVLFNDLPEQLDYSDPAVLNRLAMVYLENPLSNEFNSDTFNTLITKGGEAFMMHVFNAFKGATRADITTAEKSAFWVSPFQDVLKEHIQEGNTTAYYHIEKLINNKSIVIDGRTTSEIKQRIMDLPFEIEANKFIKENRNNLGKALRALGYRNNTANKSWKR